MMPIEWDGTRRLHNWMPAYLGASASEYSRIVGEAWLQQLCDRALHPGCAATFVLVLEGCSPELASSVFSAIVGPDRHMVGLLPLDEVWTADVSQLLPTKAEFWRARVGRWLAQKREFGVPRSCCFVAAVPDQLVVKAAETLGVWLPVQIGDVDVAGLERDRDQLFAEAMCLRGGDAYEPWVLGDGPAAMVRAAQQARLAEGEAR
jgi:predicted P-loop ATPase